MKFIQQAFNIAVADAIAPQSYYLVLVEESSYYGGPEEGGWWGSDYELIAYKEYPSEKEAEAAMEAVQKLAKELEAETQRAHSQRCNMELDWLERQGLDSDFLPEPDGPSRFHVYVTEELPENTRGSRHYE